MHAAANASLSVQQAFIKYLAERNISETTRTAYRSYFYTCFDDWLSRSISSITDEEIGDRKRQLLRRGQSFATVQQGLRLMGLLREGKPRLNVPVQLVTEQSVTDVTAETLTLRRIWTDYQYARVLKPKTLANYNQRIRLNLPDFLDISVVSITADMVERRHKEIGIRAPSMANSTMRTLRTLLHFAEVRYLDSRGTPIVTAQAVTRLTRTRGWFKDRRRKTMIPVKRLPEFYRAVLAVDNLTIRDFFLLLMLTGARYSEIRELTWDRVDLSVGTIHFSDTKTGEDPTIPLSDAAWQLLRVRHTFISPASKFVFPGRKRDTPILSVQGTQRQISEDCGLKFCPHDLRRLFISIGDDLELRPEVVKALVGHAQEGVHEGYVVRSTERLRRATQQITDRILFYAKGTNENRASGTRAN